MRILTYFIMGINVRNNYVTNNISMSLVQRVVSGNAPQQHNTSYSFSLHTALEIGRI